MDTSFQNSREHLEAELAWLDSVLWFMVQSFHQHDPETGGQGWFLPRTRVENWLLPPASESAEAGRFPTQLREAREWLDGCCSAAVAAGISLPLAEAAVRLGLSAAERLCLLVCLATELHVKYGKTYAYLQDNLARVLPSLGLIEEIAREALSPGAPIPLSSNLWKWRVVVSSDSEQASGNRMHQGLQLDSAVCAWLLKDDAAPLPLVESYADPETARRIAALAGRTEKLVIELYGPGSGDGRSVAASVATSLGRPLLQPEFHASHRQDALTRALLEALVQGSVLFAGGLGKLPEDVRTAMLHDVEPLLAEGPQIIFLQLDKPWFPARPSAQVIFAPFEMRVPVYGQRLSHWSKALASTSLTADDLSAVASRYRLSFAEIDEVARSARTVAQLRGGADAIVNPGDVSATCRLRSRGALGSRAHLITPKQSWDSLVLPSDSIEHLREVCGHVRHRAQVLHDWGFEARLSLGRGLYVLFAGPSGTGKTLAAEVIASELDVELLQVDLSGVISKYIGETEKNLELVFEVAERTDAILFFDEADALFGKRSEVKDAHDRYANIEVNFLLQRLETFEGSAILATNFAQNIDQAFSRRIHITVEFPFPDETSRLAIWRSHVPARTPVSEGLDLEFMARHFEISGANIRNVVLNAAFLAADAQHSLGMEHLLQAIRREYEKMGKPYRPGEVRSLASSGKGR